MRKMKIILSVILLVGSCTWIGCSSNNSKNPLELKSESLVLYKPLGSHGVYFDNAVAAYQKSYPDVHVQVRELGTNTTDPNVFQQSYHDLKDTLTSEFIIKINHITPSLFAVHMKFWVPTYLHFQYNGMQLVRFLPHKQRNPFYPRFFPE